MSVDPPRSAQIGRQIPLMSVVTIALIAGCGASRPRAETLRPETPCEEAVRRARVDAEREVHGALATTWAEGELYLREACQVPASLHSAARGGRWVRAGREGWLRLLAFGSCGPEHCYETLVVQWVAERLETEVVDQRAIPVPFGALLLRDGVEFLYDGSGRIQLLLDDQGEHLDDEGESHEGSFYCVTADHPGHVSVERTPCPRGT